MQRIERNGADAFIDCLNAYGVERVFANIGTDYPAFVEAFARRAARGAPAPRVVLAQHEHVGLSAAQGAAQVTGRPQVVFVHVDCGTANLGGAVGNAARARVPVLIFAGAAPWTAAGELRGSRDHWIQTYQDARDQAGIVRQYVKWDYELRTASNLERAVQRAFRVALSAPQGPVYLMAGREVLEQPAPSEPTVEPARAAPARLGVPDPETLGRLADALLGARRPLVITGDVGRQPAAVGALVALAEALELPVAQSYPAWMCFPTTHRLHLGQVSEPHVAEADLVLLLEVEVPWLQTRASLAPGATVLQIDSDPTKPDIGFWDYPVDLATRSDPAATLEALRREVAARPLDAATQAQRAASARERVARARRRREAEPTLDDGTITPEWLAHRLGQALEPQTLLIEETVSNRQAVFDYLDRTLPGTFFAGEGAGLGYGLGAALGAALAAPEREVVTLVGDGSFVFGNPTAAFWAARRYQAPFLAVIFNNQGWNAVKMVTRFQYPEGHALQADRYLAGFAPASDLAAVAAASGAHAERVERPEQLEPALERARKAVRGGQAAALDVRLAPVERP